MNGKDVLAFATSSEPSPEVYATSRNPIKNLLSYLKSTVKKDS